MTQPAKIHAYFTDPHQLMVAARGYAADRWPYFAPAFRRMIMIQTPGLGTAGVSEWGHLIYDPAAMLAWANEHGTRAAAGDERRGQHFGELSKGKSAAIGAIAGVWYHEVMHWLLEHGSKRRATRDPKMWNIACDLYINGSLERAGGCLPLGLGMYPRDFVCVDGAPFPETATAEHYYDLLRQGGHSTKPQGDGPGQGRCGSGAGGEPLPGEPDGPSGEQGGCTPEDREDVQGECAQAAAQWAKNNASKAGQLPLGWDRWLQAKEPPQVHWREHLRHATTSSLDGLGRGTRVYRRPNSRQVSLYGSLGRRAPVMPVRSAQKSRVWLVIDTSGSMSEEQVALGIGLIRQLCTARNVELYVFACDADVHGRPRKVRRVDDARPAILGGGGTDFRPIFALHEGTPTHERPDLIQIWTDGDGPAPATPPTGCHVQWLLSCPHGQARIPATWGQVYHVPLPAHGGDHG